MFKRCVFSLFALLACCLPASAQYNNRWVDDLYFVFYGGLGSHGIFLIDENDFTKRAVPSLTSDSIDFPIPHEFRSRTPGAMWHNDGVFMLGIGAFEKNEDGTEFRRNIFAEWKEDKSWQYIGSYKTDRGVSFKAIPCDGGRFIGISTTRDLTGNTSVTRSPFYRMSIVSGKEEIRLDSSIYLGMDELQEFMLDNTCFDLAFFNTPVMTDSHATLINTKTGLYWVFSLEKATLVKAGKIFGDDKKMTPEMIAKGGFTNAVLWAAPEKAGTVLVSTLMVADFTGMRDADREFDEMMKKYIGRPAAEMPSMQEIAAIDRRNMKEIAEQNPFIEWYRIYPENGKVEKIFPPEGAALDREGGKNNLWRPLPDGSVRMGQIMLNAREEPKQPKQEQKAEGVQVSK